MKQASFTGFCPEGLDLLIENRLMNDKAFYDAHKSQIDEKVITPFRALCERMTPFMLHIDPLFVTVPTRMVSRVRRDTRFTKDQTLYRANMWLFFRRPKDTQYDAVPAFYLEISPEYWGYGCYGGFGQGEMAIARDLIVHEDKIFLDAFHAAEQAGNFRLDGALYKRPRVPNAPEKYQPWLNRKHLGLHHAEHEDFSPLWDGSFVEPMIDQLSQLAPFYHFLRALHERARSRESEGAS